MRLQVSQDVLRLLREMLKDPIPDSGCVNAGMIEIRQLSQDGIILFYLGESGQDFLGSLSFWESEIKNDVTTRFTVGVEFDCAGSMSFPELVKQSLALELVLLLKSLNKLTGASEDRSVWHYPEDSLSVIQHKREVT